MVASAETIRAYGTQASRQGIMVQNQSRGQIGSTSPEKHYGAKAIEGGLLLVTQGYFSNSLKRMVRTLLSYAYLGNKHMHAIKYMCML